MLHAVVAYAGNYRIRIVSTTAPRARRHETHLSEVSSDENLVPRAWMPHVCQTHVPGRRSVEVGRFKEDGGET
eukprot:CAMPEP_0115874770 /NCGR_PEP_ID=MMETSP0287-20121206/24723_1 /TAXON_ID=412157 /ORGANISM="Chrysochromulina rotalis, Strain UIO044" /LENGTH=72 /DNA_ID=CAMNT_0003329953 /DNA_START=309 /DNA_END=527 /DNA_ORIENTATION=+